MLDEFMFFVKEQTDKGEGYNEKMFLLWLKKRTEVAATTSIPESKPSTTILTLKKLGS